ncbi:MAG TPA: class I SAM-dependent methyltransferase [Bryobacteraceae bacterium]|jgi:SAM-dependent methyltransferase
MITVDVHDTSCAICGTEGNATQLYPANFSSEDFRPEVFSARRLPDRVHYRIVRCNQCGLVRSDPVADPAMIAELYQRSTFDYGDELQNLAITYSTYLKRLDPYAVGRGELLEIGCGNGFFLQQARLCGYESIRGVEPSAAAIQSAPEDIRSRIVRSTMRPGLFANESFDVICLFQVLDHIFDPAALLRTCREILKPGGLILCLNHNAEALSARIMKSRSPIIDIEHTYLYDPKTIAELLSQAGFEVKETGSVRNRYSLGYLIHLVPLPNRLKQRLLKTITTTAIGRVSFWVPLGNLYAIAQRPTLRGH